MERTHLFGDILLLIEVEKMTQCSQSWGRHLGTAIILFKHILDAREMRHLVWRVLIDLTQMSAERANRIDYSGVNLLSSTEVATLFRF